MEAERCRWALIRSRRESRDEKVLNTADISRIVTLENGKAQTKRSGSSHMITSQSYLLVGPKGLSTATVRRLAVVRGRALPPYSVGRVCLRALWAVPESDMG